MYTYLMYHPTQQVMVEDFREATQALLNNLSMTLVEGKRVWMVKLAILLRDISTLSGFALLMVWTLLLAGDLSGCIKCRCIAAGAAGGLGGLRGLFVSSGSGASSPLGTSFTDVGDKGNADEGNAVKGNAVKTRCSSPSVDSW